MRGMYFRVQRDVKEDILGNRHILLLLDLRICNIVCRISLFVALKFNVDVTKYNSEKVLNKCENYDQYALSLNRHRNLTLIKCFKTLKLICG